MANENKGNILNLIQKNLVGAIAIVVLVAMIVPTPKVIIDLLMVLNLALAITILLVVIYTPRASSFSSFPQIILFVTYLVLQ